MIAEDIRFKIGVVQMDCALGEIEPNLAKIARFADAAGALGADLVVFPECATTGYFVADDIERLAEPVGGPTETALGRIAGAAGTHVVIGTILTEDGRYFDCQSLFDRNGATLAVYRKVHLFAGEKDCFTAGAAPTLVDLEIGKVALTVCYDMIFGDYLRHLCDLGARIILNSTNWITNTYQRERWGWDGLTTQSVASTRALENGVFVAMANRVGRELEFDSVGYSCIAGPSGKILASVPSGEGIAVADVRISAEDWQTWFDLATYREDRRPEIYGGPLRRT